jgi:hypothetical protein
MANPLFTTEQLPTTSQAAIREFEDRYLACIGATPPPTWSDLGDLIPTEAPLVTFPISSLALAYQPTTGEQRFKTLKEKSFDLKTDERDVGIQAPLLQILSKVFAYRNWLQGPARMMLAEGRMRNRAIAALLEAGQTKLWGASIANPNGIDGANFFSKTHLSDFNNPKSPQWSNFDDSGVDVTDLPSLEPQITAMQGSLDENGEKIGTDPDSILVPTEKFERLKNQLAKDLILNTDGSSFAAESNVFKGRFNVVHIPEFTDPNDFCLVDSKLRQSTGLPPWISARYMVPNPALELRNYDETSDFFKDTGDIKISSHLWYGFCLGFPHAIRKVLGA